MASAETLSFVGGLRGDRNTSMRKEEVVSYPFHTNIIQVVNERDKFPTAMWGGYRICDGGRLGTTYPYSPVLSRYTAPADLASSG